MAAVREEADAAVEAQVQMAEDRRRKEVARAIEAARKEREIAVAVVRAQAQEEQDDAVAELQEESEKLLRSMEDAMNTLRDQKSRTEDKLEEVQLENKTLQSTIDDRDAKIAALKRASFAIRMHHVIAQTRYATAFRNVFKRMKAATLDAQQRTRSAFDARVNQLIAETRAAERRSASLQALHTSLRTTLLSHKRELLVAHKVQSNVVQEELAELEEAKEELAVEKAQMERRVRMGRWGLRVHTRREVVQE